MALISGEDSPLIDRLAAKCSITDVHKGCKDKAGALRSFSERAWTCVGGDLLHGRRRERSAGAGDRRPQRLPGRCAAGDPAKIARFVTKLPGGNGAVRELMEMMLDPARSVGRGLVCQREHESSPIMSMQLRRPAGRQARFPADRRRRDAPERCRSARCSDLKFVCNHHEQASAIAAENYAKATNNLGVAMVTTGPGGTNAITGLAGAWLDSTPMLFISGR